ncbi:hypothetical protein LNAOJCKE_0427 [Methylorubrum aminovorans]|uniref:Glycoside hydrolase family 19 catalytic domain-containing protein n=1 Tax=Methylorubrum aminovorans TaxID=269069 RepID=A0ABQ4U9W2_9HYPH|nr:glycoside hydrolase family 19 protein [Methylorubrum aminovorans]GJE63233.1 hypothetical protein LNAOJCKE_0427 [Methylorubrum aminovorans]GMA79278.1 hypothetical protein GCM10025880_56950 [Methylorubrum aminovorans]
MSQSHVDGLNHLLDTWESAYGAYPRAYLAYALATTFHETARTMRPIEEYGKGKGRKYGVAVNGRVYYGRGYVQLTWDYNYKKAGSKLSVDLLNKPELALDPVIAAKIMYAGMIEGWFTGKKLSDYIDRSDAVGARRIINGTDKAALIAGYHARFLAALDASFDRSPAAAPVTGPKTGFFTALLNLFRKAR